MARIINSPTELPKPADQHADPLLLSLKPVGAIDADGIGKIEDEKGRNIFQGNYQHFWRKRGRRRNKGEPEVRVKNSIRNEQQSVKNGKHDQSQQKSFAQFLHICLNAPHLGSDAVLFSMQLVAQKKDGQSNDTICHCP